MSERTSASSWLRRAGLVAAVPLLLAGCTAGQPVDAGGDNGQGGLAFVLLALLVFIFAFGMFAMDRVRRRRDPDDEE
jgi:heme/copper-type cytochrome/quinol oxidase subunit 2